MDRFVNDGPLTSKMMTFFTSPSFSHSSLKSSLISLINVGLSYINITIKIMVIRIKGNQYEINLLQIPLDQRDV